MGERGSLPNPNARRRNARPESTGQVRTDRPKKPRSLTGEAAAEWNRIVPDLEAAGILAAVDRSVLVRYCTAWADWVECDVLLQNSGKVIKGRDGNLVRNPVWLLRRDAEQTLTDLGRQLGLTPVARIRANIEHTQPGPATVPLGVLAIEGYKKRLGA